MTTRVVRWLATLAALIATTAHASDCYAIKDPDQRNDCLAETP